jgi:lysophospholipase L1-like esterase
MRFAFPLAIVLSFASTSWVHADPAPLRILALGDSITKGIRPGVEADQTFSAVLQTRLKTDDVEPQVINVGVGGENSRQALVRVSEELNEHKPEFVLIMYGTNDSYVDKEKTDTRIPPDEFRRNLEKLIDRVRRIGAEPVLMTEPRYAEKSEPNGVGEHCNIRLTQYVEITREVAQEQRTTLVDHFAGWSAAVAKGTDLRDWTTDGYHPNPAGHAEMAERIAGVLRTRWQEQDALGISAWRLSESELRPWDELKIEGVSVYSQPGAVWFEVKQKPANSKIEFPRLNNIVLGLGVFTTPPVDHGVPGWKPPTGGYVPGEFSLLGDRANFSQSPTTWTIALREDQEFPTKVRLAVVGVPQRTEGPFSVRPSGNGEIVLDARHAVPHSEKLQFEPLIHKNTIGYWVNPQDWAEWRFLPETSGEYDVWVFQGCGGGQGGSNVQVSVGDQKMEFLVEETGHFQNFRWRRIGAVQLKAGERHQLKLRCLLKAKAAVMDVRQIRLIPKDHPPEPLDLADVPPDVFVPLSESWGGDRSARPARRLAVTPDNQSMAYYVVTLPTDWNSNRKWPVLVEWTGNGPYTNDQGDRCTGRVEDGKLAIGLVGGNGAICLSLPYLTDEHPIMGTTQWWGSPPKFEAKRTVEFAKLALKQVCEEYGGDPDRIVLVGFSRGAIACNALGLHDDEIAKLWKGMVCFSHYDGVKTWPFSGSDRASAIARLERLGKTPQFILCESKPVAGATLASTEEYLKSTGRDLSQFTFLETGFINHDDAWALRPSPARTKVREWLAERWK